MRVVPVGLLCLVACVALITVPSRGADKPIHTTMEALHAHGGTPPGWTFSLPAGDAAAGRAVFVSMECYACHEVKGEKFPQSTQTPKGEGPELTGMGSHHPAEYFAESILNPNRVVVDGKGYVGADGSSKMPSFADSLTVKQLIDVVAYLKSLRAGEESGHHHHGMSGSMESGSTMKMK